MKKDIHPQWYPQAKVTCVCGATFITGSTKPEIHVEICSQCHPFFTGEAKFVDTQGRIEKFQARQKAGTGYTKKKKRNEKKEEGPRTIKEMLGKRKKEDRKENEEDEENKEYKEKKKENEGE